MCVRVYVRGLVWVDGCLAVVVRPDHPPTERCSQTRLSAKPLFEFCLVLFSPVFKLSGNQLNDWPTSSPKLVQFSPLRSESEWLIGEGLWGPEKRGWKFVEPSVTQHAAGIR